MISSKQSRIEHFNSTILLRHRSFDVVLTY